MTPCQQAAGLRADRQANAELAGAGADGKRENAGDTDDGDHQRDGRESAEDDCVEAIGSQHFGADVFERGGVLDRLVGGHIADDVGDRRDQRVRIRWVCTNKRPPKTPFLALILIRNLPERVVHGQAAPGTTCSSSTSATTPTMRRGPCSHR